MKDEVVFEYTSAAWNWNDGKTELAMSSLSAQGFTLDEIAYYLKLTKEQLFDKFREYPQHKVAYDMGPAYVASKIQGNLAQRAISGDTSAQILWNKNRKKFKSSDEKDLDEMLHEIEIAQDSKEMALAVRKKAFKNLASLVSRGELTGSELLRAVEIMSERTDGKVANKIDITGTMSIQGILKEIDGMTSGLPRDDKKLVDATFETVYDGGVLSNGVGSDNNLIGVSADVGL